MEIATYEKIMSMLIIVCMIFAFTSCTMVMNIINPELEEKYNELLGLMLFTDVIEDTDYYYELHH